MFENKFIFDVSFSMSIITFEELDCLHLIFMYS